MLGERFGDPAGRRLHINFPRAGKCADRSDVSEGSAHCELSKQDFTRAIASIAIANAAICWKNNLTFPAPNGQNWSGEIFNHFAAAATNTSNCAQALIQTANGHSHEPEPPQEKQRREGHDAGSKQLADQARVRTSRATQSLIQDVG